MNGTKLEELLRNYSVLQSGCFGVMYNVSKELRGKLTDTYNITIHQSTHRNTRYDFAVILGDKVNVSRVFRVLTKLQQGGIMIVQSDFFTVYLPDYTKALGLPIDYQVIDDKVYMIIRRLRI